MFVLSVSPASELKDKNAMMKQVSDLEKLIRGSISKIKVCGCGCFLKLRYMVVGVS